MNKIVVEYWDYNCADGCCHDWGEKLYINGEEITNRMETNIEELKLILDALNVEYEIKEDYRD